MAMTCRQEPDHSTIATFVSSMEEEIPKLFCEVLLICEEMDLLGRTELMVPMETEGLNYLQEMAANINTERDRQIYPWRITIVEPVFANIRFHKKLDRFTLRSKVKVNIQWLLYCMIHNIEKIVNFGYAVR